MDNVIFNRLLRESLKQVNHGFIQYKDEVYAGIQKINELQNIGADYNTIKAVEKYIVNFEFSD